MNLLGNILGSLGGFIEGVPGPQLGMGSMFGGGQGRKPSMLEMILGQLGGQLFGGGGGMPAFGGQQEEEEGQTPMPMAKLPLQGPGSDTGLARPVKTAMPTQPSYDSTPYANYLTRFGGGPYGLR